MIPGNTSSQGKFVNAPTSVSASSGNGEATVSFTLPTYVGKGTATYLVTASPGGATASGSSSPITVTGLSNVTAYTFTVTTVSNYGVTKASSASNSVTPVAPPFFPPFFPPHFPPGFPPPNPCAGYTCVSYPTANTYLYSFVDCSANSTAQGCFFGGYWSAWGDPNCGCPATFAQFQFCLLSPGDGCGG